MHISHLNIHTCFRKEEGKQYQEIKSLSVLCKTHETWHCLLSQKTSSFMFAPFLGNGQNPTKKANSIHLSATFFRTSKSLLQHKVPIQQNCTLNDVSMEHILSGMNGLSLKHKTK